MSARVALAACRTLAMFAAAILCLVATAASAQTPSKFDGRWTGSFRSADREACLDAGSTTQAITVENGRLRASVFVTDRGAVLLTGGFHSDGQFNARGYQAGRGSISLSGAIEKDRLTGRWTSDAGARMACSGEFTFMRP